MLHHALRAAAVRKTLAYVASAASSESTITIPATAQAGDLAVLYDLTKNTNAYPTFVTPDGWTVISDLNGGAYASSMLSYKILVAGDPGATITGMAGAVFNSKSLSVFRATPSLARVTVLESAEEYTTGDPTAQVKTAQLSYPYLVYGVAGGVSTVPSWVEWADNSVWNPYQLHAWKFFNAGAASCSVDCNDSGIGTFLISCILKVS